MFRLFRLLKIKFNPLSSMYQKIQVRVRVLTNFVLELLQRVGISHMTWIAENKREGETGFITSESFRFKLHNFLFQFLLRDNWCLASITDPYPFSARNGGSLLLIILGRRYPLPANLFYCLQQMLWSFSRKEKAYVNTLCSAVTLLRLL